MLMILSIIGTGVLLLATLVGLRTKYVTRKLAAAQEIPTVSLLIPARNETHAITNTLHHALALDYPRLEIIVLDDLSQDNTSEKVRAFAQDGVRFIKGKEAPPNWVGKNWACEQLAQAASGQYLIFCDTDVLLKSKGLNRIIRIMVKEKLACVSALPQLLLQNRLQIAVFPLLHWMLLLAPRRNSSFVAAYGGLMVFETGRYKQHGGYKRYHDHVLAEFKLARDFSKHDRYRFYANKHLGAALLKKPSSLMESRIRYLMPLYRSFPTLGAIHLSITLLPLLLLQTQLWLLVGLAAGFALSMRGQVNGYYLGVVLLPVICAVELTLLVVSFIQYHLGKVSWKQRSIKHAQAVT